MNENKLKQILKKVNGLSGLDKNNIVKKIAEILQKEDPSAYKGWEANGFDINYNFPMDIPSYLGGLIVEFSARQEYFSLLQVAASSGYTNAMKALIEAEADIVEVIAPLFSCYCGQRISERQCKKERSKSTIDRQDIQGRTLLHLAAQSGNLETAKFPIEKGANVDVKNNAGCTPFTFCCWM